jgi:hypothetical protein
VGETRVAVTVKLDAQTLVRLDALVARFSPFCEGRSSMLRIIVETICAAIDNGNMAFDMESVKNLLGTPGNTLKPELIRKGAR